MSKNLLIALAIFLGVIAIFSFWYAARLYSRVVVKPIKIGKPDIDTIPTPDPYKPYNTLLLGYGGGNHDGGYLTDTMIVARTDPKEKTLTLISIPRDIWVGLPLQENRDVFYKINAAYGLGNDMRQYLDRPKEFTGKAGGGQLAKHAVEKITGLPISYFIAISFNGFVQSIDRLGGVDVSVPHTFNDPFYPIEKEKDNDCGKSHEEIEELTATLPAELVEKEFPCRYEQLHFDKGIEHMDGERALKFVRSRKSETFGGDYNRSIRQMALLKAVKDKIISVNFIPKIIPFMSTLSYNVQTDIDATVFANRLKAAGDPRSYTIRTINLDTSNVLEERRSDDRQYILLPIGEKNDWSIAHEYIQQELNPVPTSTPILTP